MTVVTVGVPVRNGAATLARALDGVLGQTHRDLVVLISDNASTDDSALIAESYAARDDRVRLVRQPTALTASEHFRWLADQAETPYFLWVAHDDVHDPDYVERLVAALDGAPEAWLAFPELVTFQEGTDPFAAEPLPFRCDTRGRSHRQRLQLVTHHASIAVYGLWRTEALHSYPWPASDLGLDWILMCHPVAGAEVLQIQGTRFYYSLPVRPKTSEERARHDFYREVERLPSVRLHWRAAAVAAAGARRRGVRTGRLRSFAVLAGSHAAIVLRQRAHRGLPASVTRLWRRVRPTTRR